MHLFNSFFLFNGKYYRQFEGLGMGIPIGPTFANIFMCHHESNWIDECPLAFRPLHYFRYLDDTFLLFQSKKQCTEFYEYLNSKHPNIKFTLEHENNNSLSFLDVNITRMNCRYRTTVYTASPLSADLERAFLAFAALDSKLTVSKPCCTVPIVYAQTPPSFTGKFLF